MWRYFLIKRKTTMSILHCFFSVEFLLKGTVSVISSDPPLIVSNSQRYPSKLSLHKYELDNYVFVFDKWLFSFVVSLKSDISWFKGNVKLSDLNTFKTKKRRNLSLYWEYRCESGTEGHLKSLKVLVAITIGSCYHEK